MGDGSLSLEIEGDRRVGISSSDEMAVLLRSCWLGMSLLKRRTNVGGDGEGRWQTAIGPSL